MAPLATLNHGPSVQPVLVANGLSAGDLAWLRAMCPTVPLIELRASLTGNPGSLLTHGVIIDLLADSMDEPFCIQDADCFIIEASFWNNVSIDTASEYATCVFVRKGDAKRPPFPETFLTVLNAPLMREYRRAFGIHSESTGKPSRRARKALAEAGYGAGRVLETLKDYYDTLQQFWVVATHQGFKFRKLGGEGTTVFHIGGTSYLHNATDDLAHWDYWPLNVHYFHLRLLEMRGCERFRERFRSVIALHTSSAKLLADNPGYAAGWRRRDSDLILGTTLAETLYAEPSR